MSDNGKYDSTIKRIVDKVKDELASKQKTLSAEEKLQAKVLDIDRKTVETFKNILLINNGPMSKSEAMRRITDIYRQHLHEFSKDELLELASVTRAAQAVEQISQGLF